MNTFNIPVEKLSKLCSAQALSVEHEGRTFFPYEMGNWKKTTQRWFCDYVLVDNERRYWSGFIEDLDPGCAVEKQNFRYSETLVECMQVKTTVSKWVTVEDRDYPITDSERLDWLEKDDGLFHNIDKVSSIVGKGFIVGQGNEQKKFSTLRGAIDHTMREDRNGRFI